MIVSLDAYRSFELCQRGDTAIVKSRVRDTSGVCGGQTTSEMNMNHGEVLSCERNDANSTFGFAREF